MYCILVTCIFVIVLGSRGDTPGSTGCGHGDHSSQVGLEHISKTGDGAWCSMRLCCASTLPNTPTREEKLVS